MELIGVSMGAATVVDTALEHPDLVSALVVSGAGTSEPYIADAGSAAIAVACATVGTSGV